METIEIYLNCNEPVRPWKAQQLSATYFDKSWSIHRVIGHFNYPISEMYTEAVAIAILKTGRELKRAVMRKLYGRQSRKQRDNYIVHWVLDGDISESILAIINRTEVL